MITFNLLQHIQNMCFEFSQGIYFPYFVQDDICEELIGSQIFNLPSQLYVPSLLDDKLEIISDRLYYRPKKQNLPHAIAAIGGILLCRKDPKNSIDCDVTSALDTDVLSTQKAMVQETIEIVFEQKANPRLGVIHTDPKLK